MSRVYKVKNFRTIHIQFFIQKPIKLVKTHPSMDEESIFYTFSNRFLNIHLITFTIVNKLNYLKIYR